MVQHGERVEKNCSRKGGWREGLRRSEGRLSGFLKCGVNEVKLLNFFF